MNFKVFSTPSEVEAWVSSQNFIKEYSELKEDIWEALLDYKGSLAQKINYSLRKYGHVPKDLSDIDVLLEWLAAFSIDNNIATYRFISFSEYFILLIGGSRKRGYVIPQLLSTTLLPQYYAMEEIKLFRLCIQIQIPAGTPGTFLPEINRERPEFEILLPKDLRIRCVGLRNFLIVNDKK